jgi:hypothetical protein
VALGLKDEKRSMGDENEIAELRRRVSLIEKDVEGERTVSRHMLRKIGDVENAVLDLTIFACQRL